VVLCEFAAGLRAFGRLVRADAHLHHSQPAQVAGLREGLEGSLEARARISDLILNDDDPARSELNFALLATAKRLSTELDIDERIRRQTRPRQSTRGRMRQRVKQSNPPP